MTSCDSHSLSLSASLSVSANYRFFFFVLLAYVRTRTLPISQQPTFWFLTLVNKPNYIDVTVCVHYAHTQAMYFVWVLARKSCKPGARAVHIWKKRKKFSVSKACRVTANSESPPGNRFTNLFHIYKNTSINDRLVYVGMVYGVFVLVRACIFALVCA